MRGNLPRSRQFQIISCFFSFRPLSVLNELVLVLRSKMRNTWNSTWPRRSPGREAKRKRSKLDYVETVFNGTHLNRFVGWTVPFFFCFWTLFFLPRTLCIIAGGIVGWFYFLRFLPSDKKVFFCDVFWSIVLELAFRNGDAGCEKSQNKRTKQISARSMPWSSFFFLTSTFAVLCIFLEVLLCEKSKNKYLFLTAYFTCVSHQAG